MKPPGVRTYSGPLRARDAWPPRPAVSFETDGVPIAQLKACEPEGPAGTRLPRCVKATIPHFQVQTEVAMDHALALREELKGIAPQAVPGPSINDLIVHACALALRNHPLANGSYREGRFELHHRVNVGVAVAADDALIVPTVFDADQKSVAEIAAETQRLAARVRTGEITPPELSGATFTISNLGMFGMTAITPVINPPQAAILGVGPFARPSRATESGSLTVSC
jgi:pyruvate/2-oxoglutarate dehydrogenase complex dihydrolipoamide acyltransferase (E2) component